MGTHRLFPQGLLLQRRQPPSLVFGGVSGGQRFTVGKLQGENQREVSAWLLREVTGMRKLEAGHLAAGTLCDYCREHTWLSLISSESEVGTKIGCWRSSTKHWPFCVDCCASLLWRRHLVPEVWGHGVLSYKIGPLSVYIQTGVVSSLHLQRFSDLHAMWH